MEGLVNSAHRTELLREAASTLAALPAEMRGLKSIRTVASRVDDEIAGRAPPRPAGATHN